MAISTCRKLEVRAEELSYESILKREIIKALREATAAHNSKTVDQGCLLIYLMCNNYHLPLSMAGFHDAILELEKEDCLKENDDMTEVTLL